MTFQTETDETTGTQSKIIALAGGVGGAKLALGLYRHLQNQKRADDLVVIGNTGDDMDYYGLYASPDLDTLMYTLAGRVNPTNGWGLQGDTGNALEMLGEYGQDNWFWVGDHDLATHMVRTAMLHEGRRLTEVTETLRRRLQVECQILPMCDQPVRTLLETEEAGQLAFQDYFVRRRAADTVVDLKFDGIEQAYPSPEVRAALASPSIIICCPSNPYLSIKPILGVPGMVDLLRHNAANLVVVSPIVGGQALKGPAANLMSSLSKEEKPSAVGVAKLYAGFAQRFVLDEVDADLREEIENLHYKVLVTNTVMKTEEDKIRLAQEILQEFGA